MPDYLVTVGQEKTVTKPVRAKSLNEAISQTLVGLALFLPVQAATPEVLQIVVMDKAQAILATVTLTTLL